MFVKEFDVNPLYWVSLPGYFWECGMEYTYIKLQTLQDKEIIFSMENNISGGISSVMGDRCVESEDNKKILYINAKDLYGYTMSESLPYDEIKSDKNAKAEDALNALDDNDIGYVVEVDIKYPEEIKEQTKHFNFCPENKKNIPGKCTPYMNEIKLHNHFHTKNLKCDWTDKSN